VQPPPPPPPPVVANVAWRRRHRHLAAADSAAAAAAAVCRALRWSAGIFGVSAVNNDREMTKPHDYNTDTNLAAHARYRRTDGWSEGWREGGHCAHTKNYCRGQAPLSGGQNRSEPDRTVRSAVTPILSPASFFKVKGQRLKVEFKIKVN